MLCVVSEDEEEDNIEANGQYIPKMSMSTLMWQSRSLLMKKKSWFGNGGVMVTNHDMSSEQEVRA